MGAPLTLDVGNMILIFNAVSHKPDMMALLPEYALEQFRYLKAKHPACMQDGGKVYRLRLTQVAKEKALTLMFKLCSDAEHIHTPIV